MYPCLLSYVTPFIPEISSKARFEFNELSLRHPPYKLVSVGEFRLPHNCSSLMLQKLLFSPLQGE